MTLIEIMRRPAEKQRINALRLRWSDPRARVDALIAEAERRAPAFADALIAMYARPGVA